MPEIICTTVYQFPELSDAAKEKARSWNRELGPYDDWWDAVYEDFRRVCETLGICLKTTPVRLMGGGTRQKPCIWFSGFWSQGDGASFEGAAALNAGLLRDCRWQPADGSPSQTYPVGFTAPDDTVFDGLASTTDHQMSYPASVLKGLAPRDTVEIDGVIYQVRSTRAVGDGSEMRAQLTRV